MLAGRRLYIFQYHWCRPGWVWVAMLLTSKHGPTIKWVFFLKTFRVFELIHFSEQLRQFYEGLSWGGPSYGTSEGVLTKTKFRRENRDTLSSHLFRKFSTKQAKSFRAALLRARVPFFHNTLHKTFNVFFATFPKFSQTRISIISVIPLACFESFGQYSNREVLRYTFAQSQNSKR